MADPNLAYGDLPGAPRGGGSSGKKDERSSSGSGGFISGTFSRWKKSEAMGSFASKVSDVADKVGQQLDRKLSPKRQEGNWEPLGGQHRFDSFASPRQGNDVKWYVDGAGYMWAVSIALERAKESIWILDWWLSPELYLRRPPSKNERYRLDRLLQAAAQRGVKVNVIVYKEVTQALTRKYLTPTLPEYLHSLLPPRTDAFTSALTRLGLAATFASLEAVERESPLIEPPLPVSSDHTKHALEALHPNIAVFRHPDHLPDAKAFSSSFLATWKKTTITASTAASLPGDALRALYGMSEDAILYWAHHEKLCLVDGTTAFMGGLDLCYGRWDLNQHPIADAHPEDLQAIVFPGQDYNNARIMDFADVKNWEQNKLDRKDSSRMGWSDVSIGLHGPVVDDLKDHFVGRWNFIYKEKYWSRKDVRYHQLGDAPLSPPASSAPGQGSPPTQSTQQAQPQSYFPQQGSFPPPPPPPGSQQQGYNPQQQSYNPQQPSFPPPPGSQQQGYNPQQQGYNSQQQSYNPQQQNYNPQQQSYNPQQQSYNPQQQGYNPQQQGNQQQQQQQSFPPPPPGSQPQGQNPAYAHHAEHYTHDQPQYQPYHPGQSGSSSNAPPTDQPAQTQNAPYFPPPPSTHRVNSDAVEHQRGTSSPQQNQPSHFQRFEQHGEHLAERLEHKFEEKLHINAPSHLHGSQRRPAGHMNCQIVRSATKWSNGTPLEHSIQNAYIKIISQSQHFIYIENQFFITATGEKQGAVKNTIGQAIVERIVRAARNGQKFKVIVIMPAIPAFAGDLKEDSSLGTRAIMEFQYNSINRSGNSIMEAVANAGYDPMEYIRFYNLRSYDRINDGSAMTQMEQQSGVDYEVARREHDDIVDPAGYRAQGGAGQSGDSYQHEHYLAYKKVLDQRPPQSAARHHHRDTVSHCYMLDGPDIRSLAWADGDKQEIDCYVSEELYVHSKVLIADDRVVICGSANLNDRSQLGYHDSEIACIIEDTEQIDSYMNRNPWKATKFAATLRRFLIRKHLGLVAPQNHERPDSNFEPPGVPNNYDYDSPEDNLVKDPLADQFLNYWNQRARTNTQAFGRLFHPVPHDDVRSWDDYNKFYEVFFHKSDLDAEGKPVKVKPKYEWGHVVAQNFSGIQEVKDTLSTIQGTLVEMPLMFLIKEDVAKSGLTLNVLTEEVYT